MNNLEELAHIIRNNVFNAQADPFNISEAQVFAYDGDGCLRILAEHQDPNEALLTASQEPLNTNENGIGIITVGWAVPSCDIDTEPSEHPDRRLSHLITIINREYEDAAILTFHDETDSQIVFCEGGTGEVADALIFAMFVITTHEDGNSVSVILQPYFASTTKDASGRFSEIEKAPCQG